jgi:UPF0271 protein
MTHVKPHGALYMMAADNAVLAEGIARAVADFNPDLALYALPALGPRGGRRGLPVLAWSMSSSRTGPTTAPR